ncbi:hypothetical protein RND59_18570 [Vibrio ruber]|uniref:hypothetical protein n=1 Tax=Vibrio ruber TaxID=184755 RepID=UPI0028936675|nr:hypothetical protein [Vibrio ruber]WNJ97210.1 hypothetical protein RND59_18570 [Vibrio ruber]
MKKYKKDVVVNLVLSRMWIPKCLASTRQLNSTLNDLKKMRAFRNISKRQQDQLKAIYPVLDNKIGEKIDDWPCVAITVFDHWLTRKEFEQYFTNRSLDQQTEIDLRWKPFYGFLAKDVSCYLYKYRSVGRVIFKEPRSSSLFFQWLSRSPAAGGGQVVIPEYKAVLVQDNDDTCWLYFYCRKSVEPLLREIRKLGMYTLERI